MSDRPTEPMNLGTLRDTLVLVPRDAPICFDTFGLRWSGSLHSWRGIYAEPAIGWTDGSARHLAAALIARIDSALAGEVFTGWKGGEYTYDRESPVWVDNAGEWTSTALVGVTVEHGYVYLRTARIDR